MTDDDLMLLLWTTMSDPERWKQYRELFDKNLNQETLEVTYMRSLLTLAGPINSPEKRYTDLEDDFDA